MFNHGLSCYCVASAAHHDLGIVWPTKPSSLHSSHSIIKWKWNIWDQVWDQKWYIWVPESSSTLYEEVAQMLMAPTPSTLLSFSLSPHLWSHWELPTTSWLRKKKFGPSLQIVLYSMEATESGAALQPLSGRPRRTMVKGNPPSRQNFEQCTWIFIFPGK